MPENAHRIDLFRIAVIDDSQTFRYTLRKLLAKFPTIEVVGEAADGLSPPERHLHLVPDVITMDAKMPRLNGIEATERIKEAGPDVHVVGVSSQERQRHKGSHDHPSVRIVTKECAENTP